MKFTGDEDRFREIVSALKEEFKPKKLFLFGSRCNGTARPDSDFDFVVVVGQTNRTRIENLIRGKELVRHFPITIDAFVYSENEFEEWKNEFNSIPEIATNTGMEINLGSF